MNTIQEQNQIADFRILIRQLLIPLTLALMMMLSLSMSARANAETIVVVWPTCQWRLADDQGAGGGYMVYECYDTSGTFAGDPYMPPPMDGGSFAVDASASANDVRSLCGTPNASYARTTSQDTSEIRTIAATAIMNHNVGTNPIA
jgi:hypothetical protein